MKIRSAVRGTQEKVSNIEINVDTVYVRDNIKRIDTEDFVGWQYDEIQYSLREYQEKSVTKILSNEEYLVDVDFRLTMMEMGM